MSPSQWTNRSDRWWAHLAAMLAIAVGVVGLLDATGAAAPGAVVAATAVSVAGFEAKARWPRLPSLLLILWTAGPATVVNLVAGSEGLFFLVVVAVSFVVLTEPDRGVRLAVGAVGVLSPVWVEVVSRPDHFGWPFWMMGIAFGWLSGEQVRRFRRLVAELETTRERLATQAVQLERRRIAADLHDLVGHSLTVVLLHLTGARHQLEADPAGAAEALRDAETIGRASLAEIRRNVAALRDPEGPGNVPAPTAGDLAELVSGMAAAGSDVALDVTGDLAAVDGLFGVVLHRVVQESLSNAARHAAGAPVRVTVAVGPDAIDVAVANDAGPPAHGPAGVGLIGMRERVVAVGGTLRAGPVAGRWEVRARLPLVDQPAPDRR